MTTATTETTTIASFTGKATIALINTMGVPVSRQITVSRAFTDKDSVTLHYVIKGKRKTMGTRYGGELAIAVGWQEVTGTMNTAGDGEWESFEEGAFDKMLSQLGDVIYIQR